MTAAAIGNDGKDWVRFERPRHLPGLELVRASYARRAFPVHAHPEYVVGAIVEGAERLSIRGGEQTVEAGAALLIEPAEPHSNASLGERRLTYCVFYIPPELMERMVADLGEAPGRALPAFAAPVVRSARLARMLVEAHHALSGPGDALDQQSALVMIVAEVTSRAAAAATSAPPPTERVSRARDFLHAHFRESPCLGDLARVAGLSPFHLLRSFKRQFGLSPAAYRNQLRVMEARRLLRGGEPIAAVAADVGFVDQSHLSRQFQRVMGTTPARYARQ